MKMKNREAALEQQRLLSTFDDRLANKLYDGIDRGDQWLDQVDLLLVLIVWLYQFLSSASRLRREQ